MFDLVLVFGFSVVLAAFFKKLKMPLLVGFLVAGLLAGLDYLNTQEIHWIQHASELGAAFLMYAIGLEINFNHFRRIGWVIVWLAVLQVLMFVLLAYGLFSLFGYSLISSVIFSMTIAFSSTLLVATVLRDKKEIHSLHGRVLIGVLLIQDLIVVGLLFIIPFLSDNALDVSSFSRKILLSVLTVLVTLFFGRFLFHRVKSYFRANGDVIFLLAVAWVLFLIALFEHEYIGLPAELAGLVAGLGLNSVFERDRIASWFDPLKDYFLVFLFFYVGAKVNLHWLFDEWRLVLVLLVVVMVTKSLIGFITAGLAGFPRKVIMNVGVGLANMSELGFVLLPLAGRMNLVGERDITIFSILILLSLVVSSVILYRTGDMCWGFCSFFRALERKKLIKPQTVTNQLKDKRVLIGCHRAGWAVVRSLKNVKNLVIIDFNLQTVNLLRSMGYQSMYCDIGDRRFLDEIGLCQARMVVSTIPTFIDNIGLINFVRSECHRKKQPQVVIMARDNEEVEDLYAAGADVVFNKYVSVATDMVDYIQTTRKSDYIKKLHQRQKAILDLLQEEK